MKSFVLIASWTVGGLFIESSAMTALGIGAFYVWFIYQTVVTHK